MIDAALKGKLDCVHLEDPLTAVVFGRLRYLPAAVTAAWFRAARPWPSQSSLPTLELPSPFAFEFWPLWRDVLRGAGSVEPDIVIEAAEQFVIVEAKLWATKSAIADASGDGEGPDQLARQWFAAAEQLRARGAEPSAIVYLTAHLTAPANDLDESLTAFKETKLHSPPLYWLSWAALEGPLKLVDEPVGRRVADDVLAYLDKAGVLRFSGWRTTCVVNGPAWSYQRAPRRYFTAIPAVPSPRWKYQTNEKYFTNIHALTGQTWRYGSESK